MHIYRINKPIFLLPPEHPARQFLDAFVGCHKTCVGAEIKGVDQEWFSRSQNRIRRFSSFAYESLAWDIELDGWLRQAKTITDSESRSLAAIPEMAELMLECRTVAIQESNHPIIAMCDQVLEMLRLWKACITQRLMSLR